jgi:hypothetical protein
MDAEAVVMEKNPKRTMTKALYAYYLSKEYKHAKGGQFTSLMRVYGITTV